jgi:hypothetical protein
MESRDWAIAVAFGGRCFSSDVPQQTRHARLMETLSYIEACFSLATSPKKAGQRV